MSNCSKTNCCMNNKSSTSTYTQSNISDCQVKALYPLVSHRIVSLNEMASLVNTSPCSLRKTAQRLGVTEAAADPSFTIPYLKNILKYSLEYNTGVMDYVSDVMNHEIDF